MTGEQIEAVKHSAAFTMDEVAESIKQEELIALYAAYIGVWLRESRELSPNANQERVKADVENDIIKLAEALKQGRI